MSYSPFEVAQTIGNNFSKGMRESREESAIEQILSEAAASGDPNVVNDSMAKILSQVSPDKQGPAMQILQNTFQQIKKKQEQKEIADAYEQAGMQGYQNFPPAVQSQMLKNNQRQQQYDNIFGAPQQNAQGPGQGVQQNTSQDLSKFSDDQLAKGLMIPDLRATFQAEIDRRYQDKKLAQNAAIANTKRNSKRADKVLDRADDISYEIPALQASLDQMVDAITTGNLSFWSSNNLADMTGIEGLRDAKGAQFKTAAKEYLLGGLSRIKGRPNQWIEQQVLDAAAKIGRSESANLISTRSLQNEVDLKKAFVEVTNRINEEYENKYNEPPRNLASLVDKEMQKIATEKQTEMFNDFRAILSVYDKKHMPFKPVPKGSALSDLMLDALLERFNNDPKKAEAEARKLGYSLE